MTLKQIEIKLNIKSQRTNLKVLGYRLKYDLNKKCFFIKKYKSLIEKNFNFNLYQNDWIQIKDIKNLDYILKMIYRQTLKTRLT